MDVHDDLSGFREHIENQKRVLQNAKERQGECPRDRPPREILRHNFMLSLMLTGAQGLSSMTGLILMSFIPEAYPPCILPVDSLTHIAIRSLQLETHHRGVYLMVRGITPPNRMAAVSILVDDERSDAVLLQLYHQEEEHSRAAVDIVKAGTVMIIKEPYFKGTASGGYAVRVDHPSDVMYLEPDDHRVPLAWRPRLVELGETANDLKLKGNSFIGQEKYWAAIKEYSNALSLPTTAQEMEIIKRNRSLAYLKTKQYDAALPDTGYPDFGPEPSEKALFRAAEALYHLTRFEQCLEVVEMLCKHFPENKQASIVLDRAKRRCMEKKNGDFDFKLLQTEAKKLSPPHLNHATYIGPVEIRDTLHKGRGLFTTEKVNAGDLILCEKAFAHAHVGNPEEGHGRLTLLMNYETNHGFLGGQADLLRMLVRKLYHNPSTASAFTKLYHGSYKSIDTAFIADVPIVDVFLVERIMSLNVFGCPDSSLNSHKRAIQNESQKSDAFHSCGIWVNASYINHSCMSNVRRSFIGDMMIIRATQDMEAGTEIVFPYQHPTESNMVEKQKKLENWGFVCDCALCEDSNNTKSSTTEERENLLKQMKDVFESSQPNFQTKKIERLVDKINDTFKCVEHVPRLMIWEPLLLLTRIHMGRHDHTNGLRLACKTLRSLGFAIVGADDTTAAFAVVRWGHLVDHVVEMFLHLQSVFEALYAWEKSAQAKTYAVTAYRILVGEDTSFDRMYPR